MDIREVCCPEQGGGSSSGAPLTSGSVTSGFIGNNAVVSGSIASGSVGHFKLSSGAVRSGHVGDGAVVSGSIASGVIGSVHIASGTQLDIAELLVDDNFTAAEPISGGKAVHFISGALEIAMAAIPARMPAVGVVTDNVASGDPVRLYHKGRVGGFNVSGGIGAPIFVGNSGEIQVIQPSLSGSFIQAIGEGTSNSGIFVGGVPASGEVTDHKLSAVSVRSGHVGSGAVQGSLGGGFHTVASGTVGPNDLGSGSVLSGHVASGQISDSKMASGAIRSGHIGNTAVVSGSFASGQISTFALASGAANSGHIGSGAILGERGAGARTIASGTVGPNDLSSGAAISGHLGSGSVLGERAGGSRTIASGSVGGNDIASGGVQSGHVASGTISQFKLASGAVNSGHINAAGVPDGTKFLRDDYVWANPGGGGTSLHTVATEETVSGAVAVNLSQSGTLRVAMASVSGRMPALGVLVSGALSGQLAGFIVDGPFQFTSGLADYSGYIGQPLFVGRSGQVVTASGSWNSGGLQPSDVWQSIGAAYNSGAAFAEVNVRGVTVGGTLTIAPAPGGVNLTATAGGLTSGAVQSGHVASGAVNGFFGPTRNIASGTVGVFDFGSGAVIAGTVGSGAVRSGNVASGSIGTNHVSSGTIVTEARGTINTDIAVTEEIVSGPVAVQLTSSGLLRVAMASVSGRMPAIGVLISGSLSGGAAAFRVVGDFQYSSGLADYSGYLGQSLFVGRSGHIVTVSGSWNSGGLQSGDVWQQVGTVHHSGAGFMNVNPRGVGAAGAVTLEPAGFGYTIAVRTGGLTSGIVQSGYIGSGSVGGFFGPTRHIQSGTVGVFDLGSGAVDAGKVGSGAVHGAFSTTRHTASGTFGASDFGSGAVLSGHVGSGSVQGRAAGGTFNIASGSVAAFDMASGAILSGHVGNTAVVSGSIASGQVSNFKLSSGAINSGHVGSGSVLGERGGGALTIASGTIGPNDLASGAALSGHLGSGSTLGERGGGARTIASGTIGPNDLASGAALSGHLGSGSVVGSIGAGRTIASGTVGGNDIGSGAITSGHISSGQIGQFKLASGAVNSGHINTTGVPDGTKFLRDDFVWAVPPGGGGGPTTGTTEEIVSGAVAVHISQSGTFRVAMASVSGRMPAVGVLVSGALSGQTAAFIPYGLFQYSSGLADYSGYIGQPLMVGRSGQVVTASGSWNSGGLQAGDVWQHLGVAGNSGAAFVGVNQRGITVGGTLSIAPGPGGVSLTATAGGLTSGAVQSGHVASGAVGGFFGPTRNIQSGTIGVFDFGSGAVIAGAVGSGAVQSGNIASGHVGTNHITSGTIVTETRGTINTDLAITEEIVSGAVAVQLSASGLLRVAMASVSGRMPAIGVLISGSLSGGSAAYRLVGDFQFSSGLADYSGYIGQPLFVGRSGQIVTASGSWNSGGLQSGDAWQQVGTAHNSGAGYVNVNPRCVAAGPAITLQPTNFGYRIDVASGSIIAPYFASGARTDQAIAATYDAEASELISGGKAVAFFSGKMAATRMRASTPPWFLWPAGIVVDEVLSGAIGRIWHKGPVFAPIFNFSGSEGQVLYVGNSGVLGTTPSADAVCAIGQIINGSGVFLWGAGALSGDIGNERLQSGLITASKIADANVQSGHLDSSTIYPRASEMVEDSFVTAELISGCKAVAFASGGWPTVVRAERNSGLRLPAIGVTYSGAASGQTVQVVLRGRVGVTSSGMMASGFHGQGWLSKLYVGSGGLIVNLSGFMGGASSGAAFLSGSLRQMIGLSVSGGIFVWPQDVPTSGFMFSGVAGVW